MSALANTERLLQHLKPESLAYKLVSAYQAGGQQEQQRSDAVAKVLEDLLKDVRLALATED